MKSYLGPSRTPPLNQAHPSALCAQGMSLGKIGLGHLLRRCGFLFAALIITCHEYNSPLLILLVVDKARRDESLWWSPFRRDGRSLRRRSGLLHAPKRLGIEANPVGGIVGFESSGFRALGFQGLRVSEVDGCSTRLS